MFQIMYVVMNAEKRKIVSFRTYVTRIHTVWTNITRRVQAGKRFSPGEMVPGIYLDCNIRLDIAEESGRKVYRVVIPDKENRYPENSFCSGIYPHQRMETEDLCAERMDGCVRVRLYQMRNCPECEMFIFKDVYALKQHYGEVPRRVV